MMDALSGYTYDRKSLMRRKYNFYNIGSFYGVIVFVRNERQGWLDR